MPRQRLLQLPRRQAMARDVNHIIGAALLEPSSSL